MPTWLDIVLLTLLAGLAMPLGGIVASFERFLPGWLDLEFRHTVTALGGGALLSAVALVLVPEGTRALPSYAVALLFSAGGVTFMLLDIALVAHQKPWSQLVAMLSDFIPEAMALGATLASGSSAGLLLALLIALQNVPEGFNAFRELSASTHFRPLQLIGLFTLMAVLGPMAGLIGFFALASQPQVMAAVMLFAAGGILYLVFQDIAPQARLKRHWSPPLGAVAGFLLGVIGQMLLDR
ncbi:MAG: divalent cation transporter [Planctomycetales bacterium]|nr:divalent cation transporter [Planctomycetales bacterium]